MGIFDRKSAGSDNRLQSASMAAATLSEDVMRTLQRMFPSAAKFSVSLAGVGADMVVESPRRIVIAEFKTGNPELSLPQSTVPQILRAVEQAKAQYPDQEIVPIVITNYEVDSGIREELEGIGTKILEFAPQKTNAQNLASSIVREAGLQDIEKSGV